jgi:PqqD family protein of HPr-rel-A system
MTYDTSRLKDLAISETGFLFDPMSGATFTVNAAGACILSCLREGRSRSAIIERLRTTFTIDHADLDSDLGEFVRLLVQQGILPLDFALEPLLAQPKEAQ